MKADVLQNAAKYVIDLGIERGLPWRQVELLLLPLRLAVWIRSQLRCLAGQLRGQA